MKRVCLILFLVFVFAGCMTTFPTKTNYPTTTFYVKNTSDKVQNFKASIMKQSSITGPFEMTLPFTVPPNDSIVARRVGFHKDAQPTAWFTKFIIFPTDGVAFNDPNINENWVKSTDEKGQPVYTFTLTK
jgi:hypothetical protein